MLRNPTTQNSCKGRQKRKHVNVEPGKSVSYEDLLSDEEESEDERETVENHPAQALVPASSSASVSSSRLREVEYKTIKVGHWVKVVYEGETFIGKVIEKKGGESRVQYLPKPFGIKEPQQMEKEAIFYEHVFFCEERPKLHKVGRTWKYVYQWFW